MIGKETTLKAEHQFAGSFFYAGKNIDFSENSC